MDACAIEFEDMTKKNRIHHEKRNTVFEYVTDIFNKNDHFEELTVLDDVSFGVEQGETFGIIDPNGSGKTIIRLIAGIFKPDRSTIRTNDNIKALLELETGFQPALTVKDNIILYGIIHGSSRKKITEKVEDILKFAELEKLSDTKIKNFSSGMYSRLAFSTVIHVDDILLVDEILAVGDVPFQQKSSEAFISFRKMGKPILYVSHSLESIERLVYRTLLLHEGGIWCIGAPFTVVDAYTKILSSYHN